jgi:hypothetical protein
MTLAVLAVVCAVLAGVLMWKRPGWRRTQTAFMFVVGLGLAGGVGATVRSWVVGLSTAGSATVTATVFGTGVPWAVALFLCAWLLLELDVDGLANRLRKKGRGGGASRHTTTNRHTTTAVTPWLGLLAPVALVAVPGGDAVADAARELVAAIGQAAS